MTQQVENSWIAKALNPEELKQYVEFDASLKERFTASEKNNGKMTGKTS